MSFHSWEQCQVQKNAVSFNELHLCILILFTTCHTLLNYVWNHIITNIDVRQDEESVEESSGDYEEEVEEGIGLGNFKTLFLQTVLLIHKHNEFRYGALGFRLY